MSTTAIPEHNNGARPTQRPELTPETDTPRAETYSQSGFRAGRIPGSRPGMFGKARLPRISRAEVVHLTSQLAIMLRSGVDLTSALESLARQASSQETRDILQTIHQDVMSGQPFSTALGRYDFVFGQSFIASVTAGEASGKMWQVLQQIANLKRNALRVRNRIQTLLAYPIALASISSIVVIALVFGVLPQFAQIFENYGTNLPWITQLLLGFSTEFMGRLWVWLPVLSGAAYAGFYFLRTDKGRGIIDQCLLNAFVLRDVSRALFIGRTSQLLGLLLDSGVPLLESLRLVRDSIHNKSYQELFSRLEESVMVGNGLGNLLSRSDFIPASAAEMIMTAERTGTLASVTQLVGKHYEEEGEEKLQKMTAYVEPAITIAMGLIVATIVMAVALPMFDMATMAR